MAFVRKRKTSKFWFACITLPTGKRRDFSTGLEDEAEALALATATERSLRKSHTKPHQLRTALNRLADDYSPAELKGHDAAEWLKNWALSTKGRVDPTTSGNYLNTATEAGAFFTSLGVSALDAITTQHIIDLQNHLLPLNSGATVNSKTKHLRIAFAAAIERKLLEHNPAKVPDVTETETVRRPFTPAEIERLMPTLTGEWRALFLLGLFTGQRINDLAEMPWSKIDLAAGIITITARKTGKLVGLPLLDPVRDALAELPTSDDPKAPVLPGLFAKARTTRSNLFRNMLADVGLATRISKKKRKTTGPRKTSELSFHSLRHTATTMLKSAGVSDSIARAIIGHDSVAVSRTYTHLDIPTMRSALEKMATAHGYH